MNQGNWPALLLLIAGFLGTGFAVNDDKVVFVNGRPEAIELRYWDDGYAKGCGTMQPGDECELVQDGLSGYFCWQVASEQHGRNCDPGPKKDGGHGCAISPGRIVVDKSEESEACRYSP